MLREQSEEVATALGMALAEILRGRNVLFVASSDLSHYQTQDVANVLDKRMLDGIASMNAHQVVMDMESGTAVACGYGAIATVLCAVQAWAANRATVVRYATSGDVTGDYSQVVGYGAAVFWKAA
jgi:AmmeMemoRadiSam system protein B